MLKIAELGNTVWKQISDLSCIM